MERSDDKKNGIERMKELNKSRKKDDERWAENYWMMTPKQLSARIHDDHDKLGMQAALAAILNYKAVQKSAIMITVATVGLIIATLILAASSYYQIKLQKQLLKLPPPPQRIELPVPPPEAPLPDGEVRGYPRLSPGTPAPDGEAE
ncbi:MAG: hypothetical protein ABIH66_13370 [bacterium]